MATRGQGTKIAPKSQRCRKLSRGLDLPKGPKGSKPPALRPTEHPDTLRGQKWSNLTALKIPGVDYAQGDPPNRPPPAPPQEGGTGRLLRWPGFLEAFRRLFTGGAGGPSAFSGFPRRRWSPSAFFAPEAVKPFSGFFSLRCKTSKGRSGFSVEAGI